MHPALLNQTVDQYAAALPGHTAEQRPAHQLPARRGHRLAATVVAVELSDQCADIRGLPDDRGTLTEAVAVEIMPIRVIPAGPAADAVTDVRRETAAGRLPRFLWPHLDPFTLIERGFRCLHTRAKPSQPAPDDTLRNVESAEAITTLTIWTGRARTILLSLLLLLILATAARASMQPHDRVQAPAPANQNPAGAGNTGAGGPPRFQ